MWVSLSALRVMGPGGTGCGKPGPVNDSGSLMEMGETLRP